jgi:hypothetical protein
MTQMETLTPYAELLLRVQDGRDSLRGKALQRRSCTRVTAERRLSRYEWLRQPVEPQSQ